MTSAPASLKILERLHASAVFSRRAQVLARDLACVLPPGRCVDVGSGSGLIGKAIAESRPELLLEGFDVLLRPDQAIPTQLFDGRSLPLPDDSRESVLLVDVLHHAEDPGLLLRECARVAPVVVVKDHLFGTRFDERLLAFMDWVGNRPHGVVLPYTYFDRASWSGVVAKAGLTEATRNLVPDLYAFPFSLLFGQDLHFISRLERLRKS
jgi:SAM-dependent methyltransferase